MLHYSLTTQWDIVQWTRQRRKRLPLVMICSTTAVIRVMYEHLPSVQITQHYCQLAVSQSKYGIGKFLVIRVSICTFLLSPLAVSSTLSPQWLFGVCVCVRLTGFSCPSHNLHSRIFKLLTINVHNYETICHIPYPGPYLKG